MAVSPSSQDVAAASLAASNVQQQQRQSGIGSESIGLRSSSSGPWVRRVHRINEAIFEGMQTVDQLTRKAVKQYADEVCFGWREAYAEEAEEQPDGKTFRKVRCYL